MVLFDFSNLLLMLQSCSTKNLIKVFDFVSIIEILITSLLKTYTHLYLPVNLLIV